MRARSNPAEFRAYLKARSKDYDCINPMDYRLSKHLVSIMDGKNNCRFFRLQAW